MVLITVPVFIWGLRLAVYIGIRHKSEDYRYKEMREGWEKKGSCFYYFASFVFVSILQAIFSLVINCSVLFVNIYSVKDISGDIIWSDWIGLAVWAFGFIVEVLADS